MIAENWKMDGLTARLREIEAVAASVAAKPPVAEVLICTPATLIARAVHIATGPIDIGGQDVPRSEGADVGDFMMRMGIAADHGGFALKEPITQSLRSRGYDVVDFGAHRLDPADDYPEVIVPLARAIAAGQLERGVALCGSGVGASIAANKIPGVRAGLIHDVFSARQGVEDDDMNMLCLGGKVIGIALALELIETFLSARFSGALRHRRRLAELQALEHEDN